MSIRDHISRLFPFALTFACLFLAYERPNQKVTFIAAANLFFLIGIARGVAIARRRNRKATTPSETQNDGENG